MEFDLTDEGIRALHKQLQDMLGESIYATTVLSTSERIMLERLDDREVITLLASLWSTVTAQVGTINELNACIEDLIGALRAAGGVH